jgi:putative transposase
MGGSEDNRSVVGWLERRPAVEAVQHDERVGRAGRQRRAREWTPRPDFFVPSLQRVAAAADVLRWVTPPRHNERGQTVFVTVQAVGRAFRFVPTRQVRESIEFLFALLVTKYGLLVHEFLFMSNHFHLCATDPNGRVSKFLQEFDSMLSRQLNALRGTTGKNFESEPGIQVVADREGAIDKSVYMLTNPLAAHLVEHLRQWKAASSFSLEYGESVTFRRPRCGLWAETRQTRRRGKHPSRGRLRYRGRSKAPETATLTLACPDMGTDSSPTQVRRLIRDRVIAREKELIEERRRTGKKVLGWRRVVTQHYLATPRSPRALFQRRPRVTGNDPSACAKAIAKLERFVAAYRAALEAFKGGGWPTFPYGTLQMAERYGVKCATAPP